MHSGFLCIENFFAHEVTAEIKNMFAIKNGTLSKQNDSLIFNKYKTTKIAKSLLNQKLVELLCLLTGYSQQTILTEIYNNTFLQTVILSEKSNTRDPQQKFHLDTFYPAFKFWYFPFDVTLESAPFEYVPGSHIPTSDVMIHLDDAYLDNAYDSGFSISPDHQEGSLRATDSDISRMGLQSKKFVVKANTFLIANVCGFHRRSIHSNAVVRHSIHSSIRPLKIFDSQSYV